MQKTIVSCDVCGKVIRDEDDCYQISRSWWLQNPDPSSYPQNIKRAHKIECCVDCFDSRVFDLI